jgi:hypothetical protein
LWIAHIAASGIGPDPQDVKISPGGSYRFTTALNGGGLSATRFWPKMGCDGTGNNCSIGDSGGPGEGCVIHGPSGDNYSQCAPPIDSKFEGTFMAPGSSSKDTVDMSLVDGFSLPFKLETTGGNCIRNGVADNGLVDCSGLTIDKCPAAETINGKTVDLQALNPKTGKVAGCFSPCMKLVDDKWNHAPVPSDSTEAGPYCCAGAYGGPGTCNPGPITKTKYVASMHASCAKGYAYAYDDKRATISCSTDTEYTVTYYCPITDVIV